MIDGALTGDEVLVMIERADVVLSLHRCEGFGLTLAEAMLRRKPVVATDWSGNTDFMDTNCAVPVPYKLVPVDDSCGIYSGRPDAVWAEPDVSYAATALERLSSDAEFYSKVSAAARARILPLTTGESYRNALDLVFE